MKLISGIGAKAEIPQSELAIHSKKPLYLEPDGRQASCHFEARTRWISHQEKQRVQPLQDGQNGLTLHCVLHVTIVVRSPTQLSYEIGNT